LNCTALSQSESSNFFMYIIRQETRKLRASGLQGLQGLQNEQSGNKIKISK